MCTNNPRKLAIAKRCQLIIGSYEGQLNGCPCVSSDKCKLTQNEREHYETLEDVQLIAKESEKRFRELNGW